MTEKQVIKDFVDMIEKTESSLNGIMHEEGNTFPDRLAAGYGVEYYYEIMESDEFQALKASISPVSEDGSSNTPMEQFLARDKIPSKTLNSAVRQPTHYDAGEALSKVANRVNNLHLMVWEC